MHFFHSNFCRLIGTCMNLKNRATKMDQLEFSEVHNLRKQKFTIERSWKNSLSSIQESYVGPIEWKTNLYKCESSAKTSWVVNIEG